MNCLEFDKCKFFECTLQHSKKRTWACKRGADCPSVSCKLLHPVNRTVVDNSDNQSKASSNSSQTGATNGPTSVASSTSADCLEFDKCKVFECTLSHSKKRTWACKRGADCPSVSCKLLHPVNRTVVDNSDNQSKASSNSSQSTNLRSVNEGPCNYGDKCKNLKAGTCPFDHSESCCARGVSCTSLSCKKNRKSSLFVNECIC